MMDLPAGTRNFNYAEDMTIFRTRTQKFMLLAVAAFLIAAPFWFNNYLLGVANLIGITIIAATGLNILTGYCGQLSIGHAAFMAVGAFTSAILTGRFHVPFLAAILAAGILAGLVGVLVGIPSLRVKGFYLAISTIAAYFIILWVINHWTNMTGGFMGMSVPPAEILGISFTSQASQFYLILGFTAVVIFGAKNLARTKVGRAFIAVRDNDLAAEVMGINLFNYKLLAFFIGCFLAGIAGGLTAHWVGFISGENFSLTESILYVGMIIIGGMGSTMGPIFGAIFIRLLGEVVTRMVPVMESTLSLPAGFATGFGPMLFGLVIILFLVLEPRGITHRWQLFKSSYRLWPFSY
ncbi:MAG: branched-chain amino acid ABC transporter permease [Dehalococcoidales bacterium]|nr:branched-chain amino acid ABC transporter permease [Dehalococcoidales bacterium]